MHTFLLNTHSLLRYVLLLLPIVIIFSLVMNYQNKRLKKGDEKMLLWLTIAAHTQLLIGVFLFASSSYVQFNAAMMKIDELRYWSVEHSLMMVIVVVLITLARVYSRRPISDVRKYKRVLTLMVVSLVIMLAVIAMSGRGVFIPAGQ